MFDVFYFGPKPGLFAFEQPATSIGDAIEKSRTEYCWYIYGLNDYTDFDFEYVPVPWQSQFIHVWPNQYQADGEVYLIHKRNSNNEYHYHTEQGVHRLPNPEYWDIPDTVDPSSIDWRWCPDPADPPYKYIFGNQWYPGTIDPTATYSIPGATETKFVHDFVVKLKPNMTNWEILDEVETFDYSWKPNPTELPYIYVFGNQWLNPELRPALQYRVPGATQCKYIDEPRVQRCSNPSKFKTYYPCTFDYSWEPDPGSPPYNYVFGNQWYPGEIMPTVEYPMSGATETKFMDLPAKLLEQHNNHWHTLIDCEWDYSWVPDPGDPPYIYVFGNQWWPAVQMPTVEYHVAGATERKFMEYPTAQLLADKELWTVPEEIIQDNIDFSWIPDPNEPPYIYHFGTDYQQSIGLTYTVPGATELKFAGEIPIITKEQKVIDVLDIFFVDRNNASAQTRFELLQAQYPKIQKIRYANSIMDTIQRCVARAKTNKFWIISSEYDYSNFDFAWHAQPWQNFMTHVFPSQHQKWSDTFLINKFEFERHSQWANGLEQFPNLNFVTDQSVTKTENKHAIYYVDHGNETSRFQYEYLRADIVRGTDIIMTRFVDNYLDTFKRIMATAQTEYVWIINSICDYSQFDFTWEPEPWQREMIHVFPTDAQDRGDTFYIHVESFKKQMIELELLDWFNVINYCDDQSVYRFNNPIHYYDTDNLIEEIKNFKFETPYAMFTNLPDLQFHSTPCLWTEKDRVVERYSRSGSTAMVPRDIKKYLKTQIYDYPYIDKESEILLNEVQQDIIFISYDEPQADTNWEKLKLKFPTAKRLHGVEGMHNALLAAANMSSTPWYYAVFAKTELAPNFKFNFQPDYFQEPKHYIFHARNAMNGLEYGHMGVVLYNCNIIRNQTEFGIDYTMSALHAVVPELSAIATFNSNPYQTWRTAFRESAKLSQFCDEQPTLENQHRLDVWTSTASGLHAEWCLQGARDGVMFYRANKEKPAELKQAFDWNWLRDYYTSLYDSTTEPDLTLLAQRQALWQQQ